LIKEIIDLERRSTALEPSEADRKDLLDRAWKYVNEFLNTLPSATLYNEDFNLLSLLDDYTIGDNGKSIKDIFNVIKEGVDAPGLNPASAGHLGYIPGGGIYASSIGDFIAAVVNKYAGLYFSAPGAVKVENQCLRWSAKVMGYPDTAKGNITTGGSIANLIALVTARESKGITPEKINKSVIYYSEQTHHCVNKAVKIIGLGDCQMRQIPLDDYYRMSVTAFKKQVLRDIENGYIPFYVAASCGSTDTGAVDLFADIADITSEYNIWFHVDGAYGGYFALVKELKPLFKGLERSDSVVLDPHKSLFLPYGSGVVLIREGNILFDVFESSANYLQDIISSEVEPSPADLSPELTKHFRGLRMWLPLQLYGVNPFRDCLREKYLLTQYFHEEVQKLGFEVGPVPQLSVGIYRYIPKTENANDFNAKLVKKIKLDGRIFVSSTTIDEVFWIRIAIVNFRTHKKHIDLYLSILKELIQNN